MWSVTLGHDCLGGGGVQEGHDGQRGGGKMEPQPLTRSTHALREVAPIHRAHRGPPCCPLY